MTSNFPKSRDTRGKSTASLHAFRCLFVASVTVCLSLTANAFIVIQHEGAIEPNNQGWEHASTTDNIIPGSSTIADKDVWIIDDNSTTSNSTRGYRFEPTDSDKEIASTYGWKLSAQLLLPESNDTLGSSIFIEYANGAKRNRMRFGTTNTVADPIIEINGSNSYTIDSGRDVFHEYVLSKAAGTEEVNFRVDGNSIASNIFQTNSSSDRILWGSLSSSDRGRADYHQIKFEIFPPLATYQAESYLLDGNAQDNLTSQTNPLIDVTATQDMEGMAAGAVLFNQSTSRIELQNSNFEAGDNFSISAWIHQDSATPGTFKRILSNWDGNHSGNDSGAIILESYTDLTGEKTGLRFTIFDSSDKPVSVLASKGIELGTWQLITARMVSGHMEIFIDGQSVAKTHLGETSVTEGDFNWGIGCDGEGPTNSEESFRGALDEVVFYSKALSDSDIDEIFSNRRFLAVDASTEDGSVNVSINSQLIVVFNEDVDPNSASTATFELVGAHSGPIAASISSFNKSVSITPLETLPEGEVIQLRINARLSSSSGKSLSPYTATFETVAKEKELLYWSDTRKRSVSYAGLLVDTAMGAFLQEIPVISVQSVRPMGLALRYDSTINRYTGAFGYGWTHPYEAKIDVINDNKLVVYLDKVRSNQFTRDGDSNTFISNDPAAKYDQLRIGGEGGFTGSDNYLLSRKNGDRYVFGPQGRLLGYGNRIEQYHKIEYEDTYIKAIVDPASEKRIEFTYDFETGLVTSVNDVDTENDNTPFRHSLFEYDSDHRLISIHEPAILSERQIGTDFSSKFIPDNDTSGLTYEIETEEVSPVGIVSLSKAKLTHTRHQDITITLESPSGTVETIHNRLPGSGERSFEGKRFTAFNGESPVGTWVVTITDSQTGEFGSLDEWKLQFSSPTNPQHFSYSEANFTPPASSLLTGSRDALNTRIFSVEYDSLGRVISQDDGLDSNQKCFFNYFGGHTIYTDRMGQSWTTIHNSDLRLLSKESPDGATTQWTYNDDGLCSSITDALGRKNTFTYNNLGYMQTATDPIGSTLTFAHGQSGNPSSISDEMNQTSTFQYNGNGNLRRIRDAEGGETNKTYGSNGELKQNLIEDGGGVEYTWSSGVLQGAQHMQVGAVKSDLAYDPAGRALKLTDAEGYDSYVTYRPNGDIIEKTDPLDGVIRSSYDHRSRLIEEVNKKGDSVYYEYDANDNLIRSINTEDKEYKIDYDGEDRAIREIDYDGREITYEYDTNGRRIAVTGYSGLTTRFSYDLVGNQISVTDHKGDVLKSTLYNKLNQPIAITDAYGNITKIDYDKIGRQIKITNPSGKSLDFEYDKLDRLVKVKDPLGREFTKEYYSDDMVRRISGPNANYTSFNYDQANRITNISNYFSTPNSDSYDGRGLLTSDFLPSGDRLLMKYDELGRLIELAEKDNTAPISQVKVVGYEYDINNNITNVGELTESGGTYISSTTRTYDDLERISSYRNTNGETIAYGYSDEGYLNRVTYPDGKFVKYAHDDAGRLLVVTDWKSRETVYTYDGNGKIASITFPNDTTRQMTYDEGGRITHRVDFDTNGQVIVEYQYEYDSLNNLMVESIGRSKPPYQASNVTMTYNYGNRLATFNSANVAIDKSGNMTQGPLNGVSTPYTYDVRGNMIEAGDATYHYDLEDRLSGWTDSSGTTSFTINPAAGLSQILVKTDPNNSETHYIYGVGLLYEDTPTGIRVFHYDERGNTVALSGEEGTIVGEISYGPYGETYNRTGSTDTLFRFNGLFGVVTSQENLCYMRFRWYSSEIKRFISQDAHVGNIASIGTMNRYAFAGGNPISRIDPEGEFWNTVIGAAAGAVVSVAVEFVIDVSDGSIDNGWQSYAGAAIGGAVTGAILANCPTCGVLAEASGAATTNLFVAGFDDTVDFNAGSLISDVTVAAAFGKLGGGTRGGGTLSKRATYGPSKATFFTPKSSAYRAVVRNGADTISTGTSGKSYLRAFAEDVFGGSIQTGIANLTGAGLNIAANYTASNIGNMFNDSSILLPYSRSGKNPKAYGNIDVMNRSRSEIIEGQQGVYGEFNHWKLYTGNLELAQEPIPKEIGNELTTF